MSEWISVKDRFPDTESSVLVFCNCSGLNQGSNISHMDIANYNKNYNVFSNEFSWLVTHWQPLPSPPESQ